MIKDEQKQIRYYGKKQSSFHTKKNAFVSALRKKKRITKAQYYYGEFNVVGNTNSNPGKI